MEVTIQQLGEVKFEASARGHRVVCDQPADNGGADSGMTPPEFLLVSLGTCAAFYAAQYMKVRSLAHLGLEVKVSAEKAAAPARVGTFRIEVIVTGLDPQHQAGVLRAVKACLVHNTLLHTPAIETVVTTPVEVHAAQDFGVGTFPYGTAPKNCREILTVLSDYVDFELPPDGRGDVEHHLAGCRECLEFVESLRKAIALCHDYAHRTRDRVANARQENEARHRSPA